MCDEVSRNDDNSAWPFTYEFQIFNKELRKKISTNIMRVEKSNETKLVLNSESFSFNQKFSSIQ